MSQTKIEWTDYTFNPWQGCHKVSRACKNCYAETMANRFTPGLWGRTAGRKGQTVKYWAKPYQWNRKAEREGIRAKVFCASMADVFEQHANADTNELLNQWRSDLWSLIIDTPHLDWLLLTKRPENIMAMVPSEWADDWPANVWVGTTAENQFFANNRIHHLLKIPAPVRFLSIEPMLGEIDLNELETPVDNHIWMYPGFGNYDLCGTPDDSFHGRGIDWVIAGGESGPKAEPSHPDWFRSLRDQCVEAGVPFFFKQWGEWKNVGETECTGDEIVMYLNRNDLTNKINGETMKKVGKKAAGRLLDGREWKEMPA